MLSRRAALSVLAAVAASPAVAADMGSSIHLSGAQGSREDMTAGHLVLLTNGSGVQFRVALHPDDLSRAHWREVNEPVEVIPWMFSGHESSYHLPVWAEIEHTSGPNEIISCLERKPRASGTKILPAIPSFPSGRILYADCATEPIWPIHHYSDATPYPEHENSFVPLLHHSAGYGWITDKTWGIDIGETPQDYLLARLTAHDLGLADYVDCSGSGVVISCDCAGMDLDLKGGRLVFGLESKHANGWRTRHHLDRGFTIRNDGIATNNAWGIPSASHPDYKASFIADQVGLQNAPNGPHLPQIGGINVICLGNTEPITGEFRIWNLEVYNP